MPRMRRGGSRAGWGWTGGKTRPRWGGLVGRGGVDSPVRALGSVGGHPFFVRKGSGSRLFDEDGNEYIDYVCSWGPLILGHAHPRVVKAVQRAAENGLTHGAPCELETTLAKMVAAAMPSIEMGRFVSSGTEAVVR